MLVQYTPLSALTQTELQGLKAIVTSGIRLEGKQHFEYLGKTFSVSELLSAKRMWEQQTAATSYQQLNG
jgi:hypothetical protein